MLYTNEELATLEDKDSYEDFDARLADDEIEPREAAFMRGYEAAA